ncbi:hypothetical protein [uncultured Polaribacter sp.]|uniref:hypothetical protein n=1 Tax=uncultured Polaribacter sp. TaxID=174711 RepID=UPI0026076D2A|nr:hypothetical protein [uncultured Polaribacter sp.]
MKIFFLILLLCTLSSNFNAQSVTQDYLSCSPIATLEIKGITTAGFSFSESSGIQVPYLIDGKPNVTIEVDLKYIPLKDFNITTLNGPLLQHFTPTYNSSTNTLLFTQKSNIPGSWYGFIEFPIQVTEDFGRAELYNGDNITINASDVKANPETNPEGNVKRNERAKSNTSDFKYVDSSILREENLNDLTFEISANSTTGIVNITLENSEYTTVEIINDEGESILTKYYKYQDNISFNIDYLPAGEYSVKVTSNTNNKNTVNTEEIVLE